jgi:molybdopterin-guanine dinucleotide biosynthesis protein B
VRVFGFAGWSGSGKTTLIEKLIPLMTERRLSVSVIKHAHHAVDIDIPGKDSYRLRYAGCMEVLLASDERWALMHENRGAPEISVRESLMRLSYCDLVFIEGYKQYSVPKLEIFRSEVGKPPMSTDDEYIVAIATNAPEGIANSRALPIFDLSDLQTIIDFILQEAVSSADILEKEKI